MRKPAAKAGRAADDSPFPMRRAKRYTGTMGAREAMDAQSLYPISSPASSVKGTRSQPGANGGRGNPAPVGSSPSTALRPSR